MFTHRYWTGPAHPLEEFGYNAVKSVSPFEVIDWSDASLPELCLNECERGEGKVREVDEIRHRTNIIRWWLLYVFGGFTVHHDLIPIARLESLPYPVTASHGLTRCTSFMGFPKGHEIPARALGAIRAAPASDTATAPEVSGELLLTELAGSKVSSLLYPWDKWGRRNSTDPWALFLRFPKERYRQNVGDVPAEPTKTLIEEKI